MVKVNVIFNDIQLLICLTPLHVFFGVLAFLGLAAFGFTAFFGLAAGFFLGLTTSPILNDPEAPVPFVCFKVLFLTPALSESLR